MKMNNSHNYAFIDGQNLHLGTVEDGWKIDFKKFKIYLSDKYAVNKIYYFLGYFSEQEKCLYKNLEDAGFTIIFKIHNKQLQAKKKGNVDTDLVFEVMRSLIDNNNLNKIILVSGDGDYKKVVDYLITKNKFLKIIFPNKKYASSLYRTISRNYYDYMQNFKKSVYK